MEAGKLIDVYRHLHPASMPPAGTPEEEEDKKPSLEHLQGPLYTWRGVGDDAFAYGGKGMRIDHCLVSEGFVDQIHEVTVWGTGAGPYVHGEGFYGSDHCPVWIKIRQP